MKEYLGGIGWRMFIYFHYDGDEERYFKAIENEIKMTL